MMMMTIIIIIRLNSSITENGNKNGVPNYCQLSPVSICLVFPGISLSTDWITTDHAKASKHKI
jgi:hypothetical protein